jgi:hypothetical protein
MLIPACPGLFGHTQSSNAAGIKLKTTRRFDAGRAVVQSVE